MGKKKGGKPVKVEQEQEEDVLVAEGLDLTPVLEATKS